MNETDHVLVCFLLPKQNTQYNKLKKRKGLFWHTVLEFSFMIGRPPCLWACGETAHHGSCTWQNHPPHGCDKKERKEERRGSLYPLPWHPRRPPTRPQLLKFSPHPNSAKPRTKPLTRGPWGTFWIQTTTDQTSALLILQGMGGVLSPHVSALYLRACSLL